MSDHAPIELLLPPDHVQRYLDRVDARLPTLADPRAFLTNELNKWRERYIEFCRKVDADEPTSPEVTAFDYVETMLAIDQRLTWSK